MGSFIHEFGAIKWALGRQCVNKVLLASVVKFGGALEKSIPSARGTMRSAQEGAAWAGENAAEAMAKSRMRLDGVWEAMMLGTDEEPLRRPVEVSYIVRRCAKL